MEEHWWCIGGLEEDRRRVGGGLEEDWRRFGGGLEEDVSIVVDCLFRESSA